MCAGREQTVLSVDAATVAAHANRQDTRPVVVIVAAVTAVAVAMEIHTIVARRWGSCVDGSRQHRSTHNHEGGDNGPKSADSQVPPR